MQNFLPFLIFQPFFEKVLLSNISLLSANIQTFEKNKVDNGFLYKTRLNFASMEIKHIFNVTTIKIQYIRKFYSATAQLETK